MPTAQEVYAAAVRPLAPAERLRVAALILDELTQTAPPAAPPIDESETWSDEDLHDLTAFSLRHADSLSGNQKTLYDIYVHEQSSNSRFALGKTGSKPLFIFGVNPSTATNTETDRTMKKIEGFVEGFAAPHEFDSFIMFNLYAFRATDPKDLPSSDKRDKDLCRRNMEVIKHYLQGVEKPMAWAAWGNTINERPYLLECLSEICSSVSPYHVEWHRCGTLTELGNPRHPSRLGYKNRLQKFDITLYLRQAESRMKSQRTK